MIEDKIKTLEQLLDTLADIRQAGKRIVFTNGCFDILHSGHVLYLEAAKMEGDVLVVGLNGDKSIKRIKGDTRPINHEHDRLLVLAALAAVDYVVLFDDDTPLDLIKAIKPDVLVKGGDWAIDDIVGSDHVLSNGGKVKSLIFREGKSTSDIVERIVRIHIKEARDE